MTQGRQNNFGEPFVKFLSHISIIWQENADVYGCLALTLSPRKFMLR